MGNGVESSQEIWGTNLKHFYEKKIFLVRILGDFYFPYFICILNYLQRL